MTKTGGGIGTNQYAIKGRSTKRIGSPIIGVAVPALHLASPLFDVDDHDLPSRWELARKPDRSPL